MFGMVHVWFQNCRSVKVFSAIIDFSFMKAKKKKNKLKNSRFLQALEKCRCKMHHFWKKKIKHMIALAYLLNSIKEFIFSYKIMYTTRIQPYD